MLRASLLTALLCAAPCAAVDDLVVDQLVDQVSSQTLRTHLLALEYDRSQISTQATAAAYVAAELESYGYTVTFDPVSTSENVIARLEGSAADPGLFVVGAHFDTVSGSPGADDNATGVSAMLEMARVLANEQPLHSIEFVAFALEEIGKIGSQQRANDLSQAGVDVIGMISFDMVGYRCTAPGCQTPLVSIPSCLTFNPDLSTDGTSLVVGGNTASFGLLNRMQSAMESFVPQLPYVSASVVGNGFCDPNTRRSDHASFWDRGYPALILSDGADNRNPNYHLPGDVSAVLDFDYMQEVTQASLALVVRETFPTQVVVQPSVYLTMVASDRLSWTPDPDAVAYDVMRGDLTRLRIRSGDFTFVMEACLADDTFLTNLQDSVVPPPRGADFYIVRAKLPQGVTSWGTGTEVATRDPQVEQSSFACP